MFGQKSVLISLAARRQALVAQSEVNRREFGYEWAALKTEAARLAIPARKAGHYLSTGAKAVGTLLVLRRAWKRMRGSIGTRNWVVTTLRAARFGISLWPMFRFVKR